MNSVCIPYVKDEVVTTYAIMVTESNRMTREVNKAEVWFGYNHYINGHLVKLQGDLSYNWTDDKAAFDHAGDYWGLSLQVELGS